MHKIAIFLSTSFLLALAACGGSNLEFQQEAAKLKEVYAIHDGVMPRMSEIVTLKGSLKELPVDSSSEMTVKATVSQLEKAEDGMMQWMNNFTQPEKLRESKKHEEIMAYLEEQKVEITNVRDMMVSSIEAAERVLKLQAEQAQKK